MIKVPQAVETSGLSEYAIRLAIKQGKIPYSRIDLRGSIKTSSVRQYDIKKICGWVKCNRLWAIKNDTRITSKIIVSIYTTIILLYENKEEEVYEEEQRNSSSGSGRKTKEVF